MVEMTSGEDLALELSPPDNGMGAIAYAHNLTSGRLVCGQLSVVPQVGGEVRHNWLIIAFERHFRRNSCASRAQQLM